VSASRVLEDRNGVYEYQSSKTTNKAFYVLLGGSTNSSIAFGDNGKGWRLYNGIERNPNDAGSGLINFGCSLHCPTDCKNTTFEFWNRNIEDFDFDPSLKLVCRDTYTAPLGIGVIIVIILVSCLAIFAIFLGFKYQQHRKKLAIQRIDAAERSSDLPMQSRSNTANYRYDENESHLLEGASVEDVKNDSKFKCVNAKVNERLWVDHDATITNIPSFLKESYLFQMPHHIDKHSSRFFIKGKGGDDLIICTATDKTRGWFTKTLISAPNFFSKRDEKLRTSDGDLLIFEKKNFSFVSLPPIETDILVFAIFIKRN